MSDSEAMLHEANRQRGEVVKAAKEYRRAELGWREGPIGWVSRSGKALDAALAALQEIEQRQIEEATR